MVEGKAIRSLSGTLTMDSISEILAVATIVCLSDFADFLLGSFSGTAWLTTALYADIKVETEAIAAFMLAIPFNCSISG